MFLDSISSNSCRIAAKSSGIQHLSSRFVHLLHNAGGAFECYGNGMFLRVLLRHFGLGAKPGGIKKPPEGGFFMLEN